MTGGNSYPVVVLSPDEVRLILDALESLRQARMKAWLAAREQAVPERRGEIDQGLFAVPAINQLMDRFQAEAVAQFIALLSQSKPV